MELLYVDRRDSISVRVKGLKNIDNPLLAGFDWHYAYAEEVRDLPIASRFRGPKPRVNRAPYRQLA